METWRGAFGLNRVHLNIMNLNLQQGITREMLSLEYKNKYNKETVSEY